MTDRKELEQKLADLAARALAGLDYDLVRVQLMPGGRYTTLQVMAERKDRKAMTVEDCARISRGLSPKLDEAELITGGYTLEVSSPGIERPLVKVEDYERFAGRMARIELAAPLADAEGLKRFEGSIVRVTGRAPDAEIALRTGKGEVKVRASAIAKARLVAEELPAAGKSTKH
jgi:ribosome maturation factor RimP